MSKPAIEKHLDWVDLERWFEKKYPKQFKREVIAKWLRNDDTYNGSLVTANGEVLAEDFDPDDYEPFDVKTVRFFMQTLHDEFPEAVNSYGDVKIHFWW